MYKRIEKNRPRKKQKKGRVWIDESKQDLVFNPQEGESHHPRLVSMT
jgi:hypothetical protein